MNKILMITNALSEGGVESFLFDLSSELVKRNYSVSILVLNKKAIALKKTFEDQGVKIIQGKYSNIYNPLNIFLIKRLIKYYSIVHIHLFPVQLYAVIAKILLNYKGKLITTEHSTYNNRRNYSFFKLLDQYMYSKYEKIICISPQAETNLKTWVKINDKKILTIYNGININKFHSATNSLNKHIKIKEYITYIIMVGRFEHPKDQQTLIMSMEELPNNIHLILVGTGQNQNKCINFVKLKGLENRIHFLGNCNDVPSILKGCKLGILSTKWDGFGLVAIEYMASGIPVIASNVDGLKDVVGRKDWLFETGNSKQLSNKIQWMLKNVCDLPETQLYCKETALKYSLNKMVNNYEYIYKSI